ncbi:MAG: hypothetical protein KKH28_02000 [Elusimicrobia bacterium]|nr:hypothetical protein [Elusimicrobiota bacterium]
MNKISAFPAVSLLFFVFGFHLLAEPAVCGPKAAETPAPQEPVAGAAQDGAQPDPGPKTEKRLGKLEKKVGKIAKRVYRLEKGGAPPAARGAANVKSQLVTVAFISRKQEMKGEKLGIKLMLEFRNMTNYAINGFSGKLVFKAEGARGVYTRKIAYGHQLASGGTAQIELYISSNEAKQYLKFVKARVINVALINQKLFK